MATRPNRRRAELARPVLRTPVKSDADKVATSHALDVSMQASPSWVQAVDVHPALGRVKQNADAILANAKVITELLIQLRDAQDKQHGLRRDWVTSLRLLQGAVEVFAAGNADVVRGLGFEVANRTQSGVLGAPEGLLVKTGKHNGELEAAWKKGNAHAGFVVQHATDPHAEATYSSPKPCTRTKCTIKGLPSGSVVHVRVAAVDPTTQLATSPWSEWSSGTVR